MAFTLSREQSIRFNSQLDSGQLPEVSRNPSLYFVAKRAVGDRTLNPVTIEQLTSLGMRQIYESAKTTYFALPTNLSTRVEILSNLPNEKLQTVIRTEDNHGVVTLKEWFNKNDLCDRRQLTIDGTIVERWTKTKARFSRQNTSTYIE